jgi:hypothetical protein
MSLIAFLRQRRGIIVDASLSDSGGTEQSELRRHRDAETSACLNRNEKHHGSARQAKQQCLKKSKKEATLAPFWTRRNSRD